MDEGTRLWHVEGDCRKPCVVVDAAMGTRLIGLDAATGREAWPAIVKRDWPAWMSAGPDSLCYVKTGTTIYAVDVATGRLAWSEPTVGDAPCLVLGAKLVDPVMSETKWEHAELHLAIRDARTGRLQAEVAVGRFAGSFEMVGVRLREHGSEDIDGEVSFAIGE